MQALGQDRDFARHRTEELGVRELERPRGGPAAEGFRPAGQAGERPDHGHADDQQGDCREDEHEDKESDTVGLPDPPLGRGQRPRVEGDEKQPDDPIVPLDGTDVDIGWGTGQARKPTLRSPGIEGRHHVWIGLRHHRVHLRRRGQKRSVAVEKGHALPTLAELCEEPLERGPASPSERGLSGLLQRLAEDSRTLLEAFEQAPPLLDRL